MDRLDILIMGSSRPQLLVYLIESLQRFVLSQIQNVEYKIFLHEDFLIPSESDKTIKFCKENNITVVNHNPNIGVGPAMDYMFKKHIKAPYLLYLQDDWEFERSGIDVDRILCMMNRNQNVNCVTFHKYRNMKPFDRWEHKEVEFDGVGMCLYPGWTFNPGIWRMSKVRQHWRTKKERPEGYWQTGLGTHEQRMSHKYCEDNLGSYVYGGMGEYRYVRHLGGTWRMAEWQMNNKKPGGTLHWEFQSVKRDRAPWLGDLTERPLNKNIKLNKLGKKFYEEQPKHIKEMFKHGLPKN